MDTKSVPIFYGQVENGDLRLHDPLKYRAWLEQLEGEVELTIKPRRKQRTLDQNAYYWGPVLGTISGATGHTKEELHELFKDKFLAKRIIIWNGGEEKISVGSSKELFTQGFAEYLDKIKNEVSPMGIEIPEPE